MDLAIKEFQILELVNIAKRQESDIAALVTRCKDRQTEVTALVKELTEISELVTEFRGKKEEIEEVGHFNKATGRWTGPVRDNILTYHAELKRLVKGFMEAKERILVLEKQVRDLKNGGESMEESGKFSGSLRREFVADFCEGRVRIKTEPGEPED